MIKALSTTALGLLVASAVWANDYQIIAPSAQSVTIADGEITARLNLLGCEPGFGAACSATRQRSDYILSQKFGHGDRVAYSWEMKVDEPFVYDAIDVHLYPVRFLNNNDDPVIRFFLGNKHGFETRRQMCFSPTEFGQWHKIEVRVVWDSTTRENLNHKTPGTIQVICNGVETFSATDRPNIQIGDEVRLALGLDASISPAERDRIAIVYRNISISDW